MHRLTRFTCFCLIAVLALAPLTACGREHGDSADTTAVTDTQTDTQIEMYNIIENGVSSFTVIRSDISSEAITQATVSLRNTMSEKFDCALTISTDWAKHEEDIPTDTYEILIGETNRAESIAAKEKLGEGEFIIEAVSPQRIVIVGYNDNATIAAINFFLAEYVDTATGKSFALPADTLCSGKVYDSYAQLRAVESNLISAPSIVTRASTMAELEALSDHSPATVIVEFADGKVRCDDGISVAEAMKYIAPASMPAFRVETQADAEALVKHIRALSINDYFVVSAKPEIISYLVGEDSKARGILDYTNESAHTLTNDELNAIRTEANTCFARIILLPEWMADTETMEYLQKQLTTVWVDGGEEDDVSSLVQMITSGANGIITAEYPLLEECYTKYFRENTLSRQVFVIGHRGMPSAAPENTVEGSLLAYEKGADIIENDVYLSKDGEVVVMHDSTIDRTTNGTGKVEEMTLAQIKTYLVNKQFGNKYPNCEIPTLREYFEAFKDNDGQIFIEIKSKKTEIVSKIYEIIQEYNFADRVSIITFNTDIMRECKKVCPSISLGYLVSNYSDPADTNASIIKVNELVGDYHTTFNPNYASISNDFITAAQHRGITLWPWTVNDGDQFNQFFLYGANGITTNYANYASSLIRSFTPDSYHYEAKVGEAVSPVLTAIRYDHTEKALDANAIEVIILEGEDIAKVDGLSVTATGAGKISFIYSCSDKTLMRSTYHVVTQPITINAK